MQLIVFTYVGCGTTHITCAPEHMAQQHCLKITMNYLEGSATPFGLPVFE